MQEHVVEFIPISQNDLHTRMISSKPATRVLDSTPSKLRSEVDFPSLLFVMLK